jgi:hypothetical protein
MNTSLFFRLALSVFLCTPLFAQACWPLDERKEIDGFSELDDVLILSFKDALNCRPLDGTLVVIGDSEFRADDRGYVKLPMAPFTEQMDARLTIRISRSGYIPLTTDLVVAAGTVLNRRMVLSPALPPGKVRFVLHWGLQPEDLDLHLKGPGFHISYRNMKDAPNRAKLDHDELEGLGPETITLDRTRPNAHYGLWVDNYSGDETFTGGERVYVYVGDRLLKEIRLPRSSRRAVHILDIDGGQFRFINTPSERP